MRNACLLLSLPVLAAVFLTPSVARAEAAPSRERVSSPREESLERIRRLLDEQPVRDRLESLGLDRRDIGDRLEQLDDAQLQQLAQQLDGAMVGRGAVGFIIALLVIVVLVLLIVFLVERT